MLTYLEIEFKNLGELLIPERKPDGTDVNDVHEEFSVICYNHLNKIEFMKILQKESITQKKHFSVDAYKCLSLGMNFLLTNQQTYLHLCINLILP